MEIGVSDVSILAIVLTYNAPAALELCLRALQSQTRCPDAVLVVDNASVPPAVDAIVRLDLPPDWLTVCRQTTNSGPAGGHAAGLRQFLESSHDLAWVMDDDAVPATDCLQRLLRSASKRSGPPYVFPTWVQPDGTSTQYPAWCGFLISRKIVEKVGLPMEELFWWAEDTEYLFWRIPRAGFPVVHVPKAIVHHTQVRAQPHGNPVWKYYYEARNNVYFHVYVKRNLGRLPRKLCLLLGRAVLRERHYRGRRLLMIGRGVMDGLFRRLGKRVAVEAVAAKARTPMRQLPGKLSAHLRLRFRQVRSERNPVRFIASRLIWRSGAWRLFRIKLKFAEGFHLPFQPTSLSARYWIDRGHMVEDRDFFRSYLRSGDVVVDVGANIGVLSLTAAGVVGEAGRVIAIEPNERIFSFLAANVARNSAPQVSCRKSAVGSSTEVLRMTDLRSDDFNAVIPDGQLLNGSVRTVQSNRLDDILGGVERVDLLKVDVEGFELPVFHGAEEVLARTECIYFECSRAHCRRYGYSPSDVVDYLEAQGFSLYRWSALKAVPIADVGTVGAVCENLVAIRHAGAWEERTGGALAG